MRLFAAGFLVVLMAGTAGAQVQDGTYQLDQCNAGASDARVTISGPIIRYHETMCRLANPTRVRGMAGAVLYDAQCSGEGETWSERVFMMPTAEGGFVQVRGGYGYTYQRCF